MPIPPLNSEEDQQNIKILKILEQYREEYWQKLDPILNDRLLWRAQTFRHLVHFLPDQTILELGSGSGTFTRQLVNVSRNENLITAVTFNTGYSIPKDLSSSVEWLNCGSISEQLQGRQFDFVIIMELMDEPIGPWLLQNIYKLLKPSGQVVFYNSNPRNPVLHFHRTISALGSRKDPRKLMTLAKFKKLVSTTGFINELAYYNDFVYAPLTPFLSQSLKNVSTLLENTPGLMSFAGSIVSYAQKPPQQIERHRASLCKYEQLKEAVSIVIPCHNEEMNVGPLVTSLMELFGGYIHEIILVDDNSKDKTFEVIQRLAKDNPKIKPIHRSPPAGVGRAIKDAYKAVTGKYVLSMDCDFVYLLPEIRDLFSAAVEGYDVVVGSRFSRHSVLLNYPLAKIIANRSFHIIARILFSCSYRDLTNNLKLMRKEVVDKMELTQPEFAVNAETGFEPVLMGYSVKEISISWINRTASMGTSSFRLLKVGGGYSEVLFRLWIKYAFRRKNRKK